MQFRFLLDGETNDVSGSNIINGLHLLQRNAVEALATEKLEPVCALLNGFYYPRISNETGY